MTKQGFSARPRVRVRASEEKTGSAASSAPVSGQPVVMAGRGWWGYPALACACVRGS